LNFRKIIFIILIPLFGFMGDLWLKLCCEGDDYTFKYISYSFVLFAILLAASPIILEHLSRITGGLQSAAVFWGIAAGAICVWLFVVSKGCFHNFSFSFPALIIQLMPAHGALIMWAIFWTSRAGNFIFALIWRLIAAAGIAALLSAVLLNAAGLLPEQSKLILWVVVFDLSWGLALAAISLIVDFTPQPLRIVNRKLRVLWITALGALCGVSAVAFTQDSNLIRSAFLGAALAGSYEILQWGKFNFGMLKIPFFMMVGAAIGAATGWMFGGCQCTSACDYEYVVGDSIYTIVWMHSIIGAGLYGFLQLKQSYRWTMATAMVIFLFVIGTASVLSYADMIDLHNAATVIPVAAARPLPFGVLLFILCALCCRPEIVPEALSIFDRRSIPTAVGALLLIGIAALGTNKIFDFYLRYIDWKAEAEYNHPETLASLSGNLLSVNYMLTLPEGKYYDFSPYQKNISVYPLSAHYALLSSRAGTELISWPEMLPLKTISSETQAYQFNQEACVSDENEIAFRRNNVPNYNHDHSYFDIYRLPDLKLLRLIELDEQVKRFCRIDHKIIYSNSKGQIFSVDDQTGEKKFRVAGQNPQISPFHAHSFTYIHDHRIMEYDLNTSKKQIIIEIKPSRYFNLDSEYVFSADRKNLCLQGTTNSLYYCHHLLLIPLANPNKAHLIKFQGRLYHPVCWTTISADSIRTLMRRQSGSGEHTAGNHHSGRTR